MTRTCRTCGSIYTDTAGGRHTYKMLQGHAPAPERTTLDEEGAP